MKVHQFLVLLSLILSVIVVESNHFSSKFKHRSRHSHKSRNKGVTTTTSSSSSSSSSTPPPENFDDLPKFMKIDSKEFCAKYGGFIFNLDDNTRSFGIRGMNPWNDTICYQYAAYFYDKLEPIFEPLLLKEWKETFDYFQKAAPFDNAPPVTIDLTSTVGGSVVKTTKTITTSSSDDNEKISLPQLVEGAGKAGWLGDLSRDAMFVKLKKYDITGDFALYYKEFILLLIDEWKSVDEFTPGADTCKYCMAESRKILAKMFRFMDCDEDGMIMSEDMYNALKHLKVNQEIVVESYSTNDVVLKSDANGNAKLTLPEWNRAVYIGYWQRMLDMKGPGKTYKRMTGYRVANRGKNIVKNPPYIYGNSMPGQMQA